MTNFSAVTKLKQLPKPVYAALVILVVAIAAIAFWQVKANAKEAKWTRASEAFTKADYEQANKELSGLAMPSDAERLRVFAQTKLAVRDLDASLPAYQKLSTETKDPSYQLIVGNIYNEKKQYEDAAKVYREVIAANPNNVQAYVNLSTLYKLQANRSEAMAVAKQGVDVNPSNVTLLELWVSMTMEDKDSDAYKTSIDALKKVNPEDPLLQTLEEN